MAAHDMSEFMAEQRAHLVIVQQFQRARVDDDEWTLYAKRARVDKRRLRHEQLGAVRPIHRREDVGVQLIHTRELGGTHADRIGLEQ